MEPQKIDAVRFYNTLLDFGPVITFSRLHRSPAASVQDLACIEYHYRANDGDHFAADA
jgi:hypothetical protein